MWRMERGTRSCYEGEVGGRMFYNAAAPKGARTEGRSYASKKTTYITVDPLRHFRLSEFSERPTAPGNQSATFSATLADSSST